MQHSQLGTQLFITTLVIYLVLAALCVGAAWMGRWMTRKVSEVFLW